MSQAAKRIIPLLDRVLIQRAKPIEKTASGLLLPKDALKSLNEGRVIAVGPGTEKDKMTLKAGDRVILPSFGGMTVNLDSSPSSEAEKEELTLYKESEILAKLNDN